MEGPSGCAQIPMNDVAIWSNQLREARGPVPLAATWSLTRLGDQAGRHQAGRHQAGRHQAGRHQAGRRCPTGRRSAHRGAAPKPHPANGDRLVAIPHSEYWVYSRSRIGLFLVIFRGVW